MNPNANQPPLPPAADQPEPAGSPPQSVHDPRLGFKRRFTPASSFQPAEPYVPTPAEQMGQAMYDDPYYRPVRRADTAARKRRAIIVTVVVVAIVLGVASAVLLPMIKERNPDGLFVNSNSR